MSSSRDTLSDEVVQNMMSGYAFVDATIANRTDLFAMGYSTYLLELNNTVLYGSKGEQRKLFSEQLRASEERFYEQNEGGIRDIWSGTNCTKMSRCGDGRRGYTSGSSVSRSSMLKAIIEQVRSS